MTKETKPLSWKEKDRLASISSKGSLIKGHILGADKKSYPAITKNSDYILLSSGAIVRKHPKIKK